MHNDEHLICLSWFIMELTAAFATYSWKSVHGTPHSLVHFERLDHRRPFWDSSLGCGSSECLGSRKIDSKYSCKILSATDMHKQLRKLTAKIRSDRSRNIGWESCQFYCIREELKKFKKALKTSKLLYE